MTITGSLTVNQILRQGGLILTSVLLTKTNIDSEAIGNYETLLFVSTALSFFWLTSITQTSLSFLSGLDALQKKNAAVHIFGLLFLLSIVFFGTTILFNSTVLSFLTQRTSVPFFNWFALSQIFILPTFVAENILTVDNQPKKIVWFGVLSYIVPIFIFLLPIWFIGHFPILLPLPFQGISAFGWSFIFLFLYSVLRFLYVVLHILDLKYFSFDKKILSGFVLLTLPMVGYFFLTQFSAVFVNGLVCAFALDKPEIFAQYRFGAREFPLVIALVTSLSNSFVPILADGSGTFADLKKKSTEIAHIIFPISILLLLTSKILFPIVFNPSFVASVPIFNIYVLFVISRALFPQTVLLSLKNTKALLFASIIETIFIVVASTVLLKYFGIVGIAWSIVIGFFLEKIILVELLWRKYKISIVDYTPMKIYLGYCVMVLAAYFICTLV